MYIHTHIHTPVYLQNGRPWKCTFSSIFSDLEVHIFFQGSTQMNCQGHLNWCPLTKCRVPKKKKTTQSWQTLWTPPHPQSKTSQEFVFLAFFWCVFALFGLLPEQSPRIVFFDTYPKTRLLKSLLFLFIFCVLVANFCTTLISFLLNI